MIYTTENDLRLSNERTAAVMKAIVKVESTAAVNAEYFSDAVIDNFVASRKGSANTSRTYKNAVRRLVLFFGEKGISKPQAADVDNFINELRAEGKSAATLRLYHTVGKMFFSYLSENGIYANVAKNSKLNVRQSKTHNRRALSREQAKALLNSIVGSDEKSLRDRAIVALCLQCGLRTVEVERADVADLTDEGNYFLLSVQGKGRLEKDEQVKVSRTVATMIYAYLQKRGINPSTDGEAPLFVSTARNSSNGKRLSSQSVGKEIKARLKKIGLDSKAYVAHSLRHTMATLAIKSGSVDIREISAALRHASLNVTLRYLDDLSLETRRAELAVADALFA